MQLKRAFLPTILAVCHLGTAAQCRAELKLRKVNDSVVDAKALTIKGGFGNCINGKSFQQSALVSHKGFQYVAYYDAKRQVCLARRRLPTGAWETIRFSDYDFKSNDAHNVISMGICPADGTIHLAFDHHGNPLHYRFSNAGVASRPEATEWQASLFGPISSELEEDKPVRSVTYPRFWQTPDGGLQFCYRRGGSGNGDRMLVDYDAERGAWVRTRQIDSRKGVWKAGARDSASRCSYPNGYDYGPAGRLHVTWVWREGAHTANHDLMYAYSEDRGVTWKNDLGQAFGEPPYVHSPGVTVVEIGNALGLMNTHGQAVDSQGRIHVVMWHCTQDSLKAAGSAPGKERWGPPEARRYHHYWRKRQGEWGHCELPGTVGSRPKILLDKNDNAFAILGSRHRNTADLHVVAATAASEWTDWKLVHAEPGPFINEMLADTQLWKSDGVLSVIVQELPDEPHRPTALRILSFQLEGD